MKESPRTAGALEQEGERRLTVEEPDVKALLDHLASELAEEYVRLMTEASTQISKVAGDKENYE